MNNIPEDSMLRRHYLTEWRNNLDKQLLQGLCNQNSDYKEIEQSNSDLNFGHIFGICLFFVLLLVLF